LPYHRIVTGATKLSAFYPICSGLVGSQPVMVDVARDGVNVNAELIDEEAMRHIQ
jgi:dTDP-4-amino-4,6-dideoxygalactose transaminase